MPDRKRKRKEILENSHLEAQMFTLRLKPEVNRCIIRWRRGKYSRNSREWQPVMYFIPRKNRTDITLLVCKTDWDCNGNWSLCWRGQPDPDWSQGSKGIPPTQVNKWNWMERSRSRRYYIIMHEKGFVFHSNSLLTHVLDLNRKRIRWRGWREGNGFLLVMQPHTWWWWWFLLNSLFVAVYPSHNQPTHTISRLALLPGSLHVRGSPCLRGCSGESVEEMSTWRLRKLRHQLQTLFIQRMQLIRRPLSSSFKENNSRSESGRSVRGLYCILFKMTCNLTIHCIIMLQQMPFNSLSHSRWCGREKQDDCPNLFPDRRCQHSHYADESTQTSNPRVLCPKH